MRKITKEGRVLKVDEDQVSIYASGNGMLSYVFRDADGDAIHDVPALTTEELDKLWKLDNPEHHINFLSRYVSGRAVLIPNAKIRGEIVFLKRSWDSVTKYKMDGEDIMYFHKGTRTWEVLKHLSSIAAIRFVFTHKSYYTGRFQK